MKLGLALLLLNCCVLEAQEQRPDWVEKLRLGQSQEESGSGKNATRSYEETLGGGSPGLPWSDAGRPLGRTAVRDPAECRTISLLGTGVLTGAVAGLAAALTASLLRGRS